MWHEGLQSMIVVSGAEERKKKDKFLEEGKKKKCRDQDSNLGYCGHNAMS